jgi:hypothetical protein
MTKKAKGATKRTSFLPLVNAVRERNSNKATAEIEEIVEQALSEVRRQRFQRARTP